MAGSEPRENLRRLEREAERSRAELTQTVEELRGRLSETTRDLRERVSPAHIKADMRDYVQETGNNLLEAIQRRARENPLQALTVGAGIAYPLWRLARTIPVPVLLIGAGFALAKPASTAATRVADAAKDFDAANFNDMRQAAVNTVNDVAVKSSDAVTAHATRLGDTARSALSAAGGALSETSDRLGSVAKSAQSALATHAESLNSAASEALSHATSKANQLGDNVAAAASSAYKSGANAASAAYDAGVDSATSAYRGAQDTSLSAYRRGVDGARQGLNQATDWGEQGRRSVVTTLEQNPLLIAGVGLAIGAIIAAALPMTRTEEHLLGDAGAALKGKAVDLTQQGFDQAKERVGQIYDQTLEAAKSQGLSVDAISQQAQSFGDKFRTVAERATGAPGDAAPASNSTSSGSST